MSVASVSEKGSDSLSVASVSEKGSDSLSVASVSEKGSDSLSVASVSEKGSDSLSVASVSEKGSDSLDSSAVNKNKDLNEAHSINYIDSIEINEAISLSETELFHFESEFVKTHAQELRSKFGIGEKNLQKILRAFSKRFKID